MAHRSMAQPPPHTSRKNLHHTVRGLLSLEAEAGWPRAESRLPPLSLAPDWLFPPTHTHTALRAQ